MKLFFSIWEFRSQQISSSTENIYLLKTSVIFYDSTTCFGAWVKAHEREVYHIWGRELYRANWEGLIMCILVALKGYFKHILRFNAWPLPFPQKITNTFKKSQLPSIFGGANSSHGFFIEIWTNFIRATFFVKDEILALEHANYCSLHHEIENSRRSTRMNIDFPNKPNRMPTDFNWFIPKILGKLMFGWDDFQVDTW